MFLTQNLRTKKLLLFFFGCSFDFWKSTMRSRSRRSISEEEEEESLSSSSSESSNGNITPTSNDDVVANSSGLFVRYHQYHKLPQPFFLKLSVLKLDASLFGPYPSPSHSRFLFFFFNIIIFWKYFIFGLIYANPLFLFLDCVRK